MTTRHAILASSFLGVFQICIALYAMTGHVRIAPGVSYANLKKVTLGMSSQELISVLGPPLVVSSNTIAETYLVQLSSGHQETRYAPGRIVTLTYVQPRWGKVFVSQPALWIRFLDGKVSEVYAKEYWMGNDAVMLVLSQETAYENPHAREVFAR